MNKELMDYRGNFLNVQRLQQQDRFDTNVAVLNKFSQELDFKSIYATTGNNYPDALANELYIKSNINVLGKRP